MKLLLRLFYFAAAWATVLPLNAETASGTAEQPVPSIESFNVNEVRTLSQGETLLFRVTGTPHSVVSIHIDGASNNAALREEAPGLYEGVYSIGEADFTTSHSSITIDMKSGNQIASTVLQESLLVKHGGLGDSSSSGVKPVIDTFYVDRIISFMTGTPLKFRCFGTPGGSASVGVTGIVGKVLLRETNPGEYAGQYTILSGDRIGFESSVTASLRLALRVTSISVGAAFQTLTAPMPIIGARP